MLQFVSFKVGLVDGLYSLVSAYSAVISAVTDLYCPAIFLNDLLYLKEIVTLLYIIIRFVFLICKKFESFLSIVRFSKKNRMK